MEAVKLYLLLMPSMISSFSLRCSALLEIWGDTIANYRINQKLRMVEPTSRQPDRGGENADATLRNYRGQITCTNSHRLRSWFWVQ